MYMYDRWGLERGAMDAVLWRCTRDACRSITPTQRPPVIESQTLCCVFEKKNTHMLLTQTRNGIISCITVGLTWSNIRVKCELNDVLNLLTAYTWNPTILYKRTISANSETKLYYYRRFITIIGSRITFSLAITLGAFVPSRLLCQPNTGMLKLLQRKISVIML